MSSKIWISDLKKDTSNDHFNVKRSFFFSIAANYGFCQNYFIIIIFAFFNSRILRLNKIKVYYSKILVARSLSSLVAIHLFYSPNSTWNITYHLNTLLFLVTFDMLLFKLSFNVLWGKKRPPFLLKIWNIFLLNLFSMLNCTYNKFFALDTLHIFQLNSESSLFLLLLSCKWSIWAY